MVSRNNIPGEFETIEDPLGQRQFLIRTDLGDIPAIELIILLFSLIQFLHRSAQIVSSRSTTHMGIRHLCETKILTVAREPPEK